MRRGEVWWAKLPRPVGRRPVVLASRDDAYGVRALVTVVPVTTRIRDIPVEVRLGREEGLPRRCVANADAITTIPKDALTELAGILGPDKVAALDAAIRFALDLD
jgi:mRNA interferase MazF